MFRAVVALIISLGFSVGVTCAQAQTDSRMKQIATSKVVKIAYRTDATPYSFTDDKKDVKGYSIDLCKGVVESMGRRLGAALKIEWVPVTTQTRFQAVTSGQADMECGASTITLGRMEDVDFSSIIFLETTGVMVRANAGINNVGDLAGKKIAVIVGTTNERALASLIKSGKFSAVLVPVKGREDGVAMLEKGETDAYASDKLLLLGAKVADAKAVTILQDDLSFEPYGVVLPRGDANLRLAVNTGLSQIFGSGQIVEIYKKWFAQIGLRPGPLMLSVFTLGALPE
jgi:glutamate/aspartate transport system substrate-binding protein